MTPLRYTLVPDGTSDAMLLPILDWLLAQHLSGVESLGTVADRDGEGRSEGLAGRIRSALREPCELLFVHRDAEKQSAELRFAEVAAAVAEIGDEVAVPYVCVVPVRMSEAWLLISESAIRVAAGNRSGRVRLAMPKSHQIESVADPKQRLHDLIRTASEQTGRKRSGLHLSELVHRVAEAIEDFTPLRRLPAFQRLEADVAKFAETWSPAYE